MPRNDRKLSRERSAAISVVRGGKQKREIASCLAMTENVVASVARQSQLFGAGKQKREIASRLAMTENAVASVARQSRLFGAGKQKREIASRMLLSSRA